MIGRMTGAATRGLLAALLIATPALLLPAIAADTSQITVLAALVAGLLVFGEYNSSCPSILEFRDAPPFNRMRFLCLSVIILTLSAILRDQNDMSALTGVLGAIGTIIGNAMDFPYSPVRLIVLTLPEDADASLIAVVRTCAGMAYMLSVVTIISFLIMARWRSWPTRNGAFNVLVNLPLFDPTAGGDVVDRLQRDGRINITIGFLLPFVIPAVVKATVDLVDALSVQNPHTIIWTLTAWAFLPASIIMRGIAMARVAELIEDKRRRTYANAQADGTLQTA